MANTKVSGESSVSTPADVISTPAGNGVKDVTVEERLTAQRDEALQDLKDLSVIHADSVREIEELRVALDAAHAELPDVAPLAEEEALSLRLRAVIEKIRLFARTGNAGKLKEAQTFLDAEIRAMRF